MHDNPYVAGPPVRSPNFYGRLKLLNDLTDPRYKCFYLVGTRRVGKTSLLQMLAETASADVIPLFVNLQRAVGRDGQLDTKRFTRVLLREVHRKEQGQLDLTDANTAVDLVECIEALAWISENASLTLYLLWDETELLADLPKGVLMALRAVLQESPSLRTVLAASKGLGGLNDRAREWQVSPFLFGFATRFIHPLTDADARALIRQQENPNGPVTVAPSTIDKLLTICGGHPYLLQALCLRLYQPEEHQLRIPIVQDFDQVLHEERLGDVFQQDYDNLSPGERAMLHHLAHGKADEVDLVQHTKLAEEGAHSLLVALTQVGLIQKLNGDYRIGNELLGHWLRSGLVKERTMRLTDQASVEIATQAYNLVGLPPQVYARLLRTLLNCQPFDRDETLRAIFSDTRIAPWRDRLRTTDTVKSRIQALIDCLQGQYASSGENALVLFLRVLSDQTNPGDACHQDLTKLANEIEHLASMRT